jgi:hypothetical protein
MKDIGKKRKERQQEVNAKKIKRQSWQIREDKIQREKDRLDRKSRPKQQPIVRGQFNQPSVPMSEEREIVVDKDILNSNVEKLNEMGENGLNG